MSATVIPFPNITLPGIGVAATSGTGNRLTGSRSEIWLCPAYDQSSQAVPLYVKIGLSERAIMVEVLAAQVANALGLLTPTPYIVTVQGKHVGRSTGSQLIGFGTLDLSTRSMARPIRDLELLFTLLEKLKIADLAAAFDEWIANDVRSPNDILLCPETNVFLIDHEAAMQTGLRADQALTNWLASRLMERLAQGDRLNLLKKIRGRLVKFRKIGLTSEAPLATGFIQDGSSIYKALVDFLIARLEHLDQLLSEKIVPEQRYLSPVSTGPNNTEIGHA
ncbi:MAG: hypothetical protein RLZ68_185 [Pseudomonadota bacterium]|jgi:hypothetical protein